VSAEAGTRGRVVLVGGGPGADDLITVRGLDRLLSADVVITDRLAPVGLLGRLSPDVEVIDAARLPGRATLTYDQITGLMIERARAGKTVVRLKGGDPFVFAHGAQEVESCTAAGIPVEVVPGVTSATAAPVLAGVPLTSTDGAAGFTVVSGHLHPDDPQADSTGQRSRAAGPPWSSSWACGSCRPSSAGSSPTACPRTRRRHALLARASASSVLCTPGSPNCRPLSSRQG